MNTKQEQLLQGSLNLIKILSAMLEEERAAHKAFFELMVKIQEERQ